MVQEADSIPHSIARAGDAVAMSPVRQFVTVLICSLLAVLNAVDAIVVFPLGAQMGSDLGFPAPVVDLLGGAFSLAAAVGGLLFSSFLDRRDRRDVMSLATGGVMVATLGSALAANLPQLAVSRLLAGLFAGPATGLILAIVIEAVPLAQRGRAIGAVVSAYGLALVVGLPIGVAATGIVHGWRYILGGLGGGGLLCLVAAWPVIGARPPSSPEPRALQVGREPRAVSSLLAFLMVGTASYSAMLITPNLPAFVQVNLGLRSFDLQLIYFCGGVLALGGSVATGLFLDRFDSISVCTVFVLLMTIALTVGFGTRNAFLAVPCIGFGIAGQLFRSTIVQTCASRAARPQARASFQSTTAAVMNAAQAAGAATGYFVLSESKNGKLMGMAWLVGGAVLLTWILLPLMLMLERSLARVGLR